MTAAWTWLSAKPNGVLVALTALQADAVDQKTDIPVAVRSVVLVMELALVSGGAFLLLLTSFVLGTLVRSLLHTLIPDAGDISVSEAVARICEAAAFDWGLVTFMSWFFQQPKRSLVQRLTGFGWSGVRICMLSVLLHLVVIIVLTLVQQQTEGQVLVSWRNVESVVYRSDGSIAIAEMVQNLLLAPMREELFFRGVIVLVVINRLQSTKWSASISSILFAVIHLANARHLGTQYSMSYVVFQVCWAQLVGLFLALELAVSGSLIKCFVLHVINNIFALGVSKTVTMDFTVVCVSVLLTSTIYSVAIAKQLQLLRRRTTVKTNKKER